MMPIVTNPSWNLANAKLAKRPLYIVVIEGFPSCLSSFRPDDQQVTLTGYGIGGYGVTGYGY